MCVKFGTNPQDVIVGSSSSFPDEKNPFVEPGTPLCDPPAHSTCVHETEKDVLGAQNSNVDNQNYVTSDKFWTCCRTCNGMSLYDRTSARFSMIVRLLGFL